MAYFAVCPNLDFRGFLQYRSVKITQEKIVRPLPTTLALLKERLNATSSDFLCRKFCSINLATFDAKLVLNIMIGC